jgi:hypothetical protein
MPILKDKTEEMFHIVVKCKPKKENEEFYGKVIGAYASVLIDYKDYEGVVELSKYYVEDNAANVSSKPKRRPCNHKQTTKN